eukprot:315291-Ditylum_brightwellii.AAC.1
MVQLEDRVEGTDGDLFGHIGGQASLDHELVLGILVGDIEVGSKLIQMGNAGPVGGIRNHVSAKCS